MKHAYYTVHIEVVCKQRPALRCDSFIVRKTPLSRKTIHNFVCNLNDIKMDLSRKQSKCIPRCVLHIYNSEAFCSAQLMLHHWFKEA